TLIAPTNGQSFNASTSTTITFVCNASDLQQLENISLYLSNNTSTTTLLNSTQIVSGTAAFAVWEIDVPLGTYYWNCEAYDNDSRSSMAAADRSFSIGVSNGTTETITVTVPGPSGGGGGGSSKKDCADGFDNDGDGLIDLADPGCSNREDNSEYNTPCKENWACEGWNGCNGELITRTCTDLNNCDTYGLKPITEKGCQLEILACTNKDYVCTEWMECSSDGKRRRLCYVKEDITCMTNILPSVEEDCIQGLEASPQKGALIGKAFSYFDGMGSDLSSIYLFLIVLTGLSLLIIWTKDKLSLKVIVKCHDRLVQGDTQNIKVKILNGNDKLYLKLWCFIITKSQFKNKNYFDYLIMSGMYSFILGEKKVQTEVIPLTISDKFECGDYVLITCYQKFENNKDKKEIKENKQDKKVRENPVNIINKKFKVIVPKYKSEELKLKIEKQQKLEQLNLVKIELEKRKKELILKLRLKKTLESYLAKKQLLEEKFHLLKSDYEISKSLINLDYINNLQEETKKQIKATYRIRLKLLKLKKVGSFKLILLKQKRIDKIINDISLKVEKNVR
ncbi:MAG: hypothetical protein ABIH82_05650, partial [Candidatus Woesearchaeota archaeon]